MFITLSCVAVLQDEPKKIMEGNVSTPFNFRSVQRKCAIDFALLISTKHLEMPEYMV